MLQLDPVSTSQSMWYTCDESSLLSHNGLICGPGLQLFRLLAVAVLRLWTSALKNTVVYSSGMQLVLCCCWLCLYIMDFDILALGSAYTSVVCFFATFVACGFLC